MRRDFRKASFSCWFVFIDRNGNQIAHAVALEGMPWARGGFLGRRCTVTGLGSCCDRSSMYGPTLMISGAWRKVFGESSLICFPRFFFLFSSMFYDACRGDWCRLTSSFAEEMGWSVHFSTIFFSVLQCCFTFRSCKVMFPRTKFVLYSLFINNFSRLLLLPK